MVDLDPLNMQVEQKPEMAAKAENQEPYCMITIFLKNASKRRFYEQPL